MAEPDVDLLLVDDEPDFRSTIARRFLRRGYLVHEAASGAEALELLEKRQFHVAVIDLMMPGMSGMECLERFKRIDPDCQVVMLTGQSAVDTAVQAMKLGAYDYLEKPFPLAELEILGPKGLRARATGEGKPAVEGRTPATRAPERNGR